MGALRFRRVCRPAGRSRRNRLAGIASPIHHPSCRGHGCARKARRRQPRDGNSDPRTGATSIELDPLEWIHRIASHIPDPGRHCQRFYGAYSNRGRISIAAPADETAGLPAASLPERDNSDGSREARSTWANGSRKRIKKIFETSLLCTCGGRMRIVSFITDPRIVDRILRHRESGRCKTPDPFEPRPPPGASTKIPQ